VLRHLSRDVGLHTVTAALAPSNNPNLSRECLANVSVSDSAAAGPNYHRFGPAEYLSMIERRGNSRRLGAMESSANPDARQKTVNRPRFNDQERSEGGHWRVQRDADPAMIYARYARARARRLWAIAIVALLSGLAWAVLILLIIAVLS
jgi:hypothetical protein